MRTPAPIAPRPAYTNESCRLVRRIETEHFVYCAWQPASGRECEVTLDPTSAAARHWLEAQGLTRLRLKARLSALAHLIGQIEDQLARYWGPALDTRREW